MTDLDRIIEQRAAEALAECKRMAESARRSIGQNLRRIRERLKKDRHDRPE